MEKLKMVLAMLVFGTLGVFVTSISLPSAALACARAWIAVFFLAAVLLLGRRRLHRAAIRKNATLLLYSGAAIGFNWIFLFEAYRYTTVAVATLCYYMAPVFVILLSPFVLREKLTPPKLLCTLAAVAGAVLISGAAGSGGESLRGVAFGLAAAVLYCSVILTNQFIRDLPALEKTFCQLFAAAAAMLPYVLLTVDVSALTLTAGEGLLVLTVGVVHTGVAYLLFFSAVGALPAQTTAVFSYFDPVTAILLSALFLRQPLTPAQIAGAALILGSTLANELLSHKKTKKAA